MNRTCIIVPIVFACVLSAGAMAPTEKDSILVTLAGAGGITYSEVSDYKGFANALAYASFRHDFTKDIFAKVTLRASRSLNMSFLHEGYFGWHGTALDVDAGFLSRRLGTALIYRPAVFLAPLFERYILWDAGGFGARLVKTLGWFGLEGSFTLNNRESGALALATHITMEHWNLTLLGGFKSYTPEMQDNELTVGAEALVGFKHVRTHTVIKYSRYFGYDHESNPTMEPGFLFEGLFECAVLPIDALTFSGFINGSIFEKRYVHQRGTGGVEMEWMFRPRFGNGAAFECRYSDGVITTAPELFAVIKPVIGHSELRIAIVRRRTDNSSPVYTLNANLWLDF